MGIKSLEGVTQIAEESIAHIYPSDGPRDVSNEVSIFIDHERNTITFKIQEGPIKENGKNGCQATDIIRTARIMIANLNAKFPCRENEKTLMHLDEAIEWQETRTKNREARGVEGTSQA